MKKLVLMLSMVFMLCVLNSCGGGETSSSEPGAGAGKKTAMMIDVTSENLTDALADLKAAGFTNVSSNADTDKEWKENRWIVISQSVEVGENYSVNDEIKLTCKKSCLLYLKLTSESNFMFSTYDMDIYVDDELVGTVENGKTITKLMQLLEGKYTIIACKSGDNSLKATKQLTITSDITFKSDIAHSGSSIEFKNMETLDSIVGASIKVPKVTGKVLREAMTELQEAGFINVREEPYSDIWDKDNWIVTKQGVESGTEVDQNEFIQLDCIKLDQYFNESYSGKTLAEVENAAKKSGLLLKYVSDEDRSDLSDTINSLEDNAKEYWIVVSAEQYTSEPKTAKIYLKYEGSPEEKKKAEEEKKKSEEEKKKAEEEKKKAEEEKKKAEEEKKKAEEEEKKAEVEKKKKAEEEKKKAEEEKKKAEEEKKKAEEEKKKAEEEKKKAEEEKKKAEAEKKKAEESEKNKESTAKASGDSSSSKEESQKEDKAKQDVSQESTKKNESSVYYSSNDSHNVKKGNSGVYSYKNKGGTYDVFYVIDFDDGYVYFFTDGNGDSTCDRVKIEYGDLNHVLVIVYHDGDNKWAEGFHFKYVNQPTHLVLQDQNGFETDFYATDLSHALEIRDTKTIHDY